MDTIVYNLSKGLSTTYSDKAMSKSQIVNFCNWCKKLSEKTNLIQANKEKDQEASIVHHYSVWGKNKINRFYLYPEKSCISEVL